ncbi:MAG: hypothetical protein DWQ07_03750 [Chloroflexi bacterium]|nr:MAG: hypothetical protein DWQ07_03750 [Chloroflexota bacterium]MBL1193383.1 hypothetical protein [Chloroflexota bacterium]NOH10675.1 hypothetical protein [Chloroflexota bacterium]
MVEVLQFLKDFEAVIYFLLGAGGIWYIYGFGRAWQEMRSAVFGLERDSAQRRLNAAAVSMFVLFALGLTVFVLVTFVAPVIPAGEIVPTQEIRLGETPVGTLSVDGTQEAGVAADPLATATPLPTVAIAEDGCVPAQLVFSAPEAGSTIRGNVEVTGTVDIENFGFYKFEVARADEALWLTIQAGRNPVIDNVLVESWDTSRLPPGDYVLQLIVTNNAGEELPACRIPVRIDPPAEEDA